MEEWLNKDDTANKKQQITTIPQLHQTKPAFFIGFMGWFAIHANYYIGYSSIESLIVSGLGSAAMILICILPLVLFALPLLNIIVLGYLLYRKIHWVVFGALSAFIANSIGIILIAPPDARLFKIICMIPFFVGMGPMWGD